MQRRSQTRAQDAPSSGEEPNTHAESGEDTPAEAVEERDTHTGDDMSFSRNEDVNLPRCRLQGLTTAVVITVYISWLYVMMRVWCLPIVLYILYKTVRPPHLL